MSPAMNRRFDLIVFDWDGTLFDSTGLITRCIQAACADVGTAVPNDRAVCLVLSRTSGSRVAFSSDLKTVSAACFSCSSDWFIALDSLLSPALR